MSELEDLLRAEFEAAEGSFLLQLRIDLHWDRDAFSRLVVAMHDYVKELDPRAPLERWVAEGFWFLERFVPEWTAHPNFPRSQPPEYYERALMRIRDLSYYLFTGQSPYEGNGGFDPF